MAHLHFTEGQSHPPYSVATPKQLLVNVVDGMARTRPEAAYALIPKSFTSYSAGYQTITYRKLANAINKIAWLLKDQITTDAGPQTLAYIGPNDIGYIACILGAVKAGHVILCVSPRNTAADNAALIAATECKTLLTLAPPYSATANSFMASVGNHVWDVIHVPTIYELVDEKDRTPHFPYPKTYTAAKDEPLAMVHTSGTTSTPKLITYTHAYAASYANWSWAPAPEGYESPLSNYVSLRAFNSFPFFHGGGLMVSLFMPITNQTTLVCPLAGVAPSAAGILEALNHVEVDVVHMPAPFVEQIAKDESMLDKMASHARAITYGGGDISQACADAFVSRVYVTYGYGSTETGSMPMIRSLTDWEPSDLKYGEFHPIAGLRFEPTGIPDLFEAVQIRNANDDDIQPVFTLFPELREWRTKDLFTPHPTKPNLWAWRSRADDMIVSASGEMCNPVPFEQHVCRRPDVAAALMVGTGRYQKALLVEPTDEGRLVSPDTWERFIDEIWHTVEEANALYPEYSHVTRGRILLTEMGVPLPRAGKGTVQRAPSLTLYRDQIERMYNSEGGGKEMVAKEPYKIHIAMEDAKIVAGQ